MSSSSPSSPTFHQGDIDFICDDSFFTTGDGHIKANRVALSNLSLPWLNGENTACYIKCMLVEPLVKLKDCHLLLLEALQGIHVQLDTQAGFVRDGDLAINDL